MISHFFDVEQRRAQCKPWAGKAGATPSGGRVRPGEGA